MDEREREVCRRMAEHELTGTWVPDWRPWRKAHPRQGASAALTVAAGIRPDLCVWSRGRVNRTMVSRRSSIWGITVAPFMSARQG